jgi:hypothetical protein
MVAGWSRGKPTVLGYMRSMSFSGNGERGIRAVPMEKATGPRFLSPSSALGPASTTHDHPPVMIWTAVTDEYGCRECSIGSRLFHRDANADVIEGQT